VGTGVPETLLLHTGPIAVVVDATADVVLNPLTAWRELEAHHMGSSTRANVAEAPNLSAMVCTYGRPMRVGDKPATVERHSINNSMAVGLKVSDAYMMALKGWPRRWGRKEGN
jgi:hypothetical protein